MMTAWILYLGFLTWIFDWIFDDDAERSFRTGIRRRPLCNPREDRIFLTDRQLWIAAALQ
jgi:hypothetical protein